MRSLLRQTLALTWAELLRLMTSPVWATLLVLWTVVASLFFMLVVERAAEDALPIGQTPVTAFFTSGPGLLSLILLVFVPHLTMEAVAGRRERGRLEHLEAGGLAPLALVLGSFLATGAALSVLALPPLAIHLVLSAQGDTDPGHTLGGILALGMEAAALASLGLAASAWARTRLSASLIAVAAGVSWWLLDAFAHLAGHAEGDRSWLASLSLQRPIHDFALALVERRTLAVYALVIVAFLALARAGLLIRSRPWPRLMALAGVLAAILGSLVLAGRMTGTWDISRRGLHAVSPLTFAAFDDLRRRGPVAVTIVASGAAQDHPVEGPVLRTARDLVKRLHDRGVAWSAVDPLVQPEVVAALCRDLGLTHQDLARPLLVLTADGQNEILRFQDLALGQGHGRQEHLTALRVEPALLAAALRIRDGALTRAAWMIGPRFRPREAASPAQRDAAVGAWRRLTADLPCQVTEYPDYRQAIADNRLLILAGPRSDPDPAGITAIESHLAGGGSLLLALDGRDPAPLPGLARILAPYGVAWNEGSLASEQGWKEDRPDLLPVVELRPGEDEGPAALAGQDGRGLHLPFAVPLRVEAPLDSRLACRGWLATPPSTWIQIGRDAPRRLETPRPLLVTAAPVVGGQGPRIAVLGSCDAFADGALAVGGNRRLAAGILRFLTRPQDPDLLPPRAVEATRYHLSPSEKALLRYGVGAALPLAALVLALALAWWRRRA